MNFFKPDYTPRERSGHKQGRRIATADGWAEYNQSDDVDLHKILTGHKSSITLMPIETNIMRNSGLHAGGFMIVDRSKKPQRGNIIVVLYNGAIVVRRLEKSLTMWALMADDPREEKLLIHPDAEVELMGVCTFAVKPLCLIN